MYRAFLIVILFLLGVESVFAVHPFGDVPVGSPYYDAVDTLYNNKILLDDGSGLFRPQASIGRDAFVGFSVSVACKACLVPSMDDLVRYQISPFPDLRKENPYYYCIAYAKDQDIVQGYILDQNGRTKCQNGTEFTVSPFCEGNNTTRIEAVAMLLRQAKLWDDTKNSTTTKRITITDVTDYWYGYAQKGIEAGLVTLVGTQILPDESITRGEFAVMAAKVLKYNQCLPPDGTYSLASSITVESTTGSPLDRTTFTRDERFSLVGVIDTSGTVDSGMSQNAVYRWTAVNATTGARVTYEGERLPSSLLSPGNWYISMDVVDRRNGSVVTRSSTTLTIGDGSAASGNTRNNGGTGNGNTGNNGGTGNGNSGNTPPSGGTVIGDGWGGSGGGTNNTPPPSAIAQATVSGVVMPSVILSADTLTPSIGANVGFDVTSLGVGPLTYSWNYGDGSRSTTMTTLSGTSGGSTTHTYSTPGTYTVTVMMTDGNGRTVQSSVVISVVGKKDSDGDGVIDGNDRCPGVAGTSANFGCPVIDTNGYSNGSWPKTGDTSGNQPPTLPGYGIGSKILIESELGKPVIATTFTRDERFSLVGVIDTSGTVDSGMSQNAVYRWTAVNATTGARVTYEGERLPSSLLSPGNWYISMDVVDRRNGSVVTRSSTTLTIGDGSAASGNTRNNGGTGNGNTGNNGGTGNGNSGNTPPSGGTVIGDGWGGSGGGTNNTPPPSAIAQATVSGVVMPSVILSADTLTPSIGANVGFDVTSLGVGPLTYSWNYGDGSRSTTMTTLSGTSGGSTTHTYSTPGTYTVTVMMTDGNGRTVQSSVVISVVGKKDSDGDGVIDGNDRCPGVAGTSANFGCPSITSLLGNIEKNACLMSKIQSEGLLVISPVCDSCPCPNTVSLGDGIRSCDVIFPAILSLDLKTIYSRGSLFQVK